MAHPLIENITSADPKIRNQSLDAVCEKSSADELLAACAELDAFRRAAERVGLTRADLEAVFCGNARRLVAGAGGKG